MRDATPPLGVVCCTRFCDREEANFLELDGASAERVRAAYSPEDWERLVGLKDRYDPDNLFRFNRNIPPSSTGQ